MRNGNLIRRELRRTWTVSRVAEHFGVTTMTIHNWRKERGLPALVLPASRGGRPALRFLPEEVRWWAKAEKQKRA